MLTISSGHSADYLTGQVGAGRESYYLGAVTVGEPPGRWWGAGAKALGLEGQVDNDVMTALYSEFLDPRDPRFADPETRPLSDRLGRAPRQYRSRDDLLGEALGVSPERLTVLRAEATAEAAVRSRSGTADKILVEKLAAESGKLPEDVRRMWADADRSDRQPVAFIDATFSPVKSFTVLHTAIQRAELDAHRAGDESARQVWAGLRTDVEQALWAGNNTMLQNLSERAGYSRVGRHGAGAGRWTDAHDWTVASFHQSDSRDHDPQQHIHNAILNRVVCADGEIRTLDSRAIHEWKQAAGAIGERAMEEELSRRLGVGWVMRADGNGREIVGIDKAVMDLFATRSATIGTVLRGKVANFEAHYGRTPNALEMSRLRQQTSLATRRAKSHAGETLEQRSDRWNEQLWTHVGIELNRVAEQVAGRAGQTADMRAEAFSPGGVIDEAVDACQEKRAAFSRSELERQITMRLPYLGGLDGEQVTGLVRRLGDRAEGKLVPVSGQQLTGQTPADLRLADGRSVYASPGGPKFATRDHVVAEQALRRAAVERGRAAVSAATADAWLARHGGTLGEDQRAAIRGMLTGGAKVTVLVGPAGTGKSFTLGKFAEAWHELTGGRVVGLATSEQATRNLRDDGMDAVNTRAWLKAQERLAAGGTFSKDTALRVGAADVIVLDESSMADHVDVEKIRAYVDRAGGGLSLTGDPQQLGAIGAGGSMAMLTDVADTYRLTEVRRFVNTWEREASLRLRDRDRDVLDEYDRRGRVLDEGTIEQALHAAARGYVGDTLAGKSSLVFAATNRQAAQAAAMVRDMRVELGQVAAGGVELGTPGDLVGEGNLCGVGDLVQARQIDRSIGVINRDRFVVREIREDGSMVVEPEGSGPARTLPAAYVRDHLALGYAGTVHCAQGATIDTTHPVITPQMGPDALYVGMTRGRERNTAHVATQPEVAGEHTGETHERDRRSATGVLVDILEREDPTEQSAFVQRLEAAREANNMHTIHAFIEDGVRDVTRRRTETYLDRLAAEGVLSDPDRLALAADQGTEQLSRLLRTVEQAGHSPEQALRDAISERSLTDARSPAQVLHHRVSENHIGRLAPHLDELSMSAIPVDVPEDWRGYLGELTELADGRRLQIGSEIAEQAPRWAVEAFGAVPDGQVERLEWETKAGTVAAYREATSWSDEAEPIGPSPGTSSTERRVAWHQAWSVLGRPEATAEEEQATDGQLRNRVRAWEREQEWQPPDVFAEQQATEQAIEKHRQDAALLAARADVAADAVEADRLRAEATDRAALADTMVQVAAKLEVVAQERGAWMVETALTAELAERAKVELSNRGRPIDDEDDRTTAEKLIAELAAEQAAGIRAEDPHREIGETDLVDEHTAESAREEVDEHQAVDDIQPAAGDRDANLADREAEQDVEDRGANLAPREPAAEADEHSAKLAQSSEPELPPGVPSAIETEAAATKSREAALEMADRASAEETHRQADATKLAEAEQADREQAWRDADRHQTEHVAEQEYDLSL